MFEWDYGKPDAGIEVNGSQFRIWVCKNGIRRVFFPEETGRYTDGVRPVLRLEILSKTSDFECRCLESLLDYLAGIFNGEEPSKPPAYSLDGLSSFARDVLNSASGIPWGSTRSYSWVAHEIKRDRASRAVGSALGRNPLPIIIPCHRVIRSDGGLGGFSAGLPWKQRLLSIESKERPD